jgi:hypothetical protein
MFLLGSDSIALFGRVWPEMENVKGADGGSYVCVRVGSCDDVVRTLVGRNQPQIG